VWDGDYRANWKRYRADRGIFRIGTAELTTDAKQEGESPQDLHRRGNCVIVDTNELRSSLLLNNTMGAALLFALQLQNGKLGWPEVIEDEIRKQALLRADEAIKRVRSELRVLEILVGSRPDPRLPSIEDVDSAISRRIADLAPLLIRVPFTIEHARAALRRVNDQTPPNGQKNQQFKDSAIWEAILELAVTHRMHFVTKDTGFYQGRDPKNGLAIELSNECARAGFEIHVYPELASCVEELRTAAPPFDVAAVVAALDVPLRIELSPDVAKRDFALGEVIKSSVSAFITERLGVLAIKYDVVYSGIDKSSQPSPRTDASIRASGNARFDMGSGIASDVQLGNVEFDYADAEGVHRNVNLYIGIGSVSVGERLVQYSLEHPIGP
jgi:hypothetical protein